MAAASGSWHTAYLLQRRLIFALVGVLIMTFSVVLFFGREARAQGTIDPGHPAHGPVADGSGGGGGGAANCASSFGTPASSLVEL
jgi:hypothetical protein